MMDWRETVSVAVDALRANKVRAMLTSLGVIIGSASIVLVVTVALTSKKFVLSQIESIGSNLVWVELVRRPDTPQPLSYEMTLEDLEAVKSIPKVIEVAGSPETTECGNRGRGGSAPTIGRGNARVRGGSRLRGFSGGGSAPRGPREVQRQVGQLLKGRHSPEAEYKVQTLTAILGAAKNISLALTILLILIAFIALLISGIGIMNIMLVTVQQRTREIGIRKAIGAARREIMYQFLVESLVISGGGAVIGILLGIAIPVTAQFFLPGRLRGTVSSLNVIVAFVVSGSTGLFLCYLPANTAASLEPVESLRYE